MTVLDVTRIVEELQSSPIGHTIYHYQSVPSTMPIAHQLATQPEVRSGTLVVAEEQTAGRGRLQRRWEVPMGAGLLVSMILKPPLAISPAQLPMASGLAVCMALQQALPSLVDRIGLKWPNDLLIGDRNGAAYKVAGILVEAIYTQAELSYAIVGIGINVHQHADQLPPPQPGAYPPASLYSFLQNNTFPPCSLDRTDLLMTLCQSYASMIQTPRTSVEILQTWRSHLWTLGAQVTARTADGKAPRVSGTAIDVTDDGALIIEAEDGQRCAVSAGDVMLRSH